MVSYLNHRFRPFRHDAPTLCPAQRIDALARRKGEVIPYPYVRLWMDIEVDTIEHLRPLPQVSPSYGESQAHPVVSEEKLAMQESREVEELASEVTKKNSMSHSYAPYRTTYHNHYH